MTLSMTLMPKLSAEDNSIPLEEKQIDVYPKIYSNLSQNMTIALTMAVAGSIFTVMGGILLVNDLVKRMNDDPSPFENLSLPVGVSSLATGSICLIGALGLSCMNMKINKKYYVSSQADV